MQHGIRGSRYFTLAAACSLASLLAPLAQAQLWTWTKDQMLEYTKAWTGDRFPDGRPKVPDQWLQRAKDMSQEEVMVPGGRGGGGYSQFEGDWRVLHPELKMTGRVVTMEFMPNRADLDSIVLAKAKTNGIQSLNNQYVLDMLQPGDVLVVDLYGKHEGGTIVGDNLFYYIMKATKGGGLVVDGAVRDLEGIREIEMPAYFRSVHPSAIGGATVAAVNVPVRIGDVTVMPGDVAIGDPEGVTFVPPQLIEGIVDRADTIHVHDEWTKKKFDEGKYKSTDIYGSPHDPALIKEYQDYLAKRLEEIRKNNPK